MIDVFHQVYKQNPDVVLLLIGDEELMKQTQERVRELELSESVVFMGVRSDIPELMLGVDLFFPSVTK